MSLARHSTDKLTCKLPELSYINNAVAYLWAWQGTRLTSRWGGGWAYRPARLSPFHAGCQSSATRIMLLLTYELGKALGWQVDEEAGGHTGQPGCHLFMQAARAQLPTHLVRVLAAQLSCISWKNYFQAFPRGQFQTDTQSWLQRP